MEPATALGAAAGGVQLIDVAGRVLLGSLRLVRELHDIPIRTAALLRDVERSTSRILNIRHTLLQPGARVFDTLPAESFARLSSTELQLRLAMEELQRLLSLLHDNASQASSTTTSTWARGKIAVRRAWGAVVTVQKQDDVTAKLEKVDRLNLEMVRELEVAGLEMQAAAGEMAATILRAVRESHDAITDRLDGVENGSRNIQAALHNNHVATVQRLDKANGDIQTVLQGSHTATVQQLSGATSGIQTTLRDNHLAASQKLDSLASGQENLHVQVSEFFAQYQIQHQQMCAIIAAITSNETPKPSTQAAQQSPELALNRAVQLGNAVCNQLLRYPESLREAHASTRLARRWLRACACRPTIHRHRSRHWHQLELAYESESDHRPSCPLYGTGSRSWAYILRAGLFPIVNQTVEFVLGATSGAGRWSVAPPSQIPSDCSQNRLAYFSPI